MNKPMNDMMTALENAIQHYPTEWEGDSSDVQNVIDSLSKSGYEIVKRGYKFTGKLSPANEISAKPSSNGDVRYICVGDIMKYLPNHGIPTYSEVTLILEFNGRPSFKRLNGSKYMTASNLKSLRKAD